MLMIEESNNLTEQEAHQVKSNHKWQSQMLPSLNDYLYAKSLRSKLIHSWDIDDQRILQSDWMRSTLGHTQPKVVAADPASPWWLPTSKNIKISIDSFLWYRWLKNPAIWFNERCSWPHPTKSSSLGCYLHLMTDPMQRN